MKETDRLAMADQMIIQRLLRENEEHAAEVVSLRARLAEAEAEAESQLRMAARWFGEYAAKSDENTRLAALVVRLTEALRGCVAAMETPTRVGSSSHVLIDGTAFRAAKRHGAAVLAEVEP